MKNKREPKSRSIRYSMFIYFSISSLVAILLISISLYTRLSNQLTDTIIEENQGLMNQLNNTLDSYLRNTMKLSDSLYYGVIKNADLSRNNISGDIELLYNNNKDTIENIALLSGDGKLLQSVPAARLKPWMDVTTEAWFQETLKKSENIHFSMPHVQYIFDSNENQYRWVISMTRAVEVTKQGETEQAVLLVDVDFSSIEHILSSISLGKGGYVYLTDSSGNIIYHPRQHLIDAGHENENNMVEALTKDGVYKNQFEGKSRTVLIKTVGYTGWKMIGVTPNMGLSLDNIKTKTFVIFVIIFIILVEIIINSYISSRVTEPINHLEKSVKEIEEGNLNADVYVGGSYEVQHLGNSIKKMSRQIQALMADVVREHEAKRRTEFDTLQSQINPHFLYNTLDIIVWMIENERQSEAVVAVTALARFFRISLSKGKNIITVKDELEHVKNYLTIQHMRYKNKFEYKFEIEDTILNLASLKLILQPLVENAIYHGMEFMDGDGKIIIKGYRENDELFLSVEDNGFGMTPECVQTILSETEHISSKRGSGIGMKNVNERIKLYFGKEYGLIIESEPDEGTKIIIHLPAIQYSEIEKREKQI